MKSFLDKKRVALVKEVPKYAKTPPYNPSQSFPEWPTLTLSLEDNPAYRAVRELFYSLGLDSENYNRSAWNPLGELIKPGNVVVLKPNLVSHRIWGGERDGIDNSDCLITHGSVIRAVLDYSAKALNGSGKIIIGDCPIQGADWNWIVKLTGLDIIQDYFHAAFPGIELVVKDYRLGRAVLAGDTVVKRIIDESAIKDYCEIDLKQHSKLIPLMNGICEFGVSQYPKHRMRAAHTPDTNRYLMPEDFIFADVVINIPKMKSHTKAGITCAMKNFVGLNGHKDYLPHFRFGSPKNGGDEYPDGNWLLDLMWFFYHCDWELDRGRAKKVFLLCGRACYSILRLLGYSKDEFSTGGGSWHGNDTVWRTVLDINRSFFYFDREQASISTEPYPNVKYMAILDGLIGGQKEGPLSPSPIESGIMMAAFNPLAMDAVAAAMMGLDIRKIKLIAEGFRLDSMPLANFGPAEIEVCGNMPQRSLKQIYHDRAFTPFEPSRGFKGYIEYQGQDLPALETEEQLTDAPLLPTEG